jgi:diaminopimelate epimerase
MDLNFYKLHSTGGDYIVSSFLHDPPPDFSVFPGAASRICKRRTGVGANGLLVITKGIEHALKASFYPANSPQSPLPGDATVCMGRFAFDSGLADNTRISCESDFGVVTTDAIDSANFRVDLGPPRNPADGEVIDPSKDVNLNETVRVGGKRLPYTPVGIHSNYAVVITDRSPRAIRRLALELSRLEEMANIQPVFMRSISHEEIAVYSWTSSGDTPDHVGGVAACVTAGILNGFCDSEVTVRFRSYLLFVQWNQKEGRLLVTAPSEYICSGSFYIDDEVLQTQML